MTADVERFLERFADFGNAPDPDKYENLFDPAEGTVLHPGMTAPLHRDQVRAYMTTYLPRRRTGVSFRHRRLG